LFTNNEREREREREREGKRENENVSKKCGASKFRRAGLRLFSYHLFVLLFAFTQVRRRRRTKC
jgi:hypothetical protein|tara:strand:+ start:214 stop:405 length:192 start_codon:yes stop_codon:yes gene_type:complete